MLKSLKNVLVSLKEGAVEAGAKAWINQQIQNFGTVTNLVINSRQKTIFIEAALKGEPGPIKVNISDYELVQTAKATYIVLKRIEASREWVSAVLQEYVAGQRLQVPASLKSVL